jgi:hypothetical protein
MTEDINRKPVGETADIIATAQRLIEAGVLTEEKDLIEAGRKKWKEVWPDDIVDLQVDLYINDLQQEKLK